MEEKRKLRPITIVLLIVVPIIVIISAAVIIFVFKYEKKKEQERIISDYQTEYNSIVVDMLKSAATAEENAGLLISVWQNAIFNKQDSATDQYTMENGEFVSDFNEAIDRLYQDQDYAAKQEQLSTEMWNIKNRMKEMTNPPEGFEDAYGALKEMYDSYLEFVNLVISPRGSFNDYSEAYNNADTDLLKKYNNAELYVK